MKSKDIELNKTYETIWNYQSYTIKYQENYYIVSIEEVSFGRCIYGLNTYIWIGKFAGNIKMLVESFDFNNRIEDREQYIKDNYKVWVDRLERRQEVNNDR